jgi:uncharacterized protein YbjT (DUF2867 family)
MPGLRSGTEGGATARELVSRGRTVRALVRHPGKAEARRLDDLDVTLVEGDMDDEDSLYRAMEGVHGVFSVQPLGWEPQTLAAEVRLFLGEGAISEHTTAVFAKLGVTADDNSNRRVLAVLTFLGAAGTV